MSHSLSASSSHTWILPPARIAYEPSHSSAARFVHFFARSVSPNSSPHAVGGSGGGGVRGGAGDGDDGGGTGHGM